MHAYNTHCEEIVLVTMPWIPQVVDFPVHVTADYPIPIHRLLRIAHMGHVSICTIPLLDFQSVGVGVCLCRNVVRFPRIMFDARYCWIENWQDQLRKEQRVSLSHPLVHQPHLLQINLVQHCACWQVGGTGWGAVAAAAQVVAAVRAGATTVVMATYTGATVVAASMQVAAAPRAGATTTLVFEFFRGTLGFLSDKERPLSTFPLVAHQTLSPVGHVHDVARRP